jgi:protein phosphatase
MRIGGSAGLTDPGRIRRRNEDAFICSPPLFAVADGMGGAQAGEIASRIATAAFREPRAADLDPEARLRSIIQEANRRIYARAASDPTVSGMGTTVTAALLADEQLALGHVGDSRAYRIRDGKLEQLTQDHSLVADLVRSGRLTPEEAQLHPQRSVITRALGTDAAVTIDSSTVDARAGDVFLLCSDGLTAMLDDATVLDTVSSAPDLEQATRSLVQLANRKGGEDNITVVLFSIEEGEPGDEDTLSGLSVPTAASDVPSPPRAEPAGKRRHTTAMPATPPRSGIGRALLLVVLVLVLFAGVAAVALWGLSRAHFIGVDTEGRFAVYQGVPWEVLGVELYRETYVSPLLALQLSPEERRQLLDHELVSDAEARARLAPYEDEASP